MSSESSIDSDRAPSNGSFNDENDDPELESDLEDDDEQLSGLDTDEDEDLSTDVDDNNSDSEPGEMAEEAVKSETVKDFDLSPVASSSDLVKSADSGITNNDAGFDSDDSDELFSITKSVSVQSLISMNNIQAAVKKRSIFPNDDKRERLASKRRKTTMGDDSKKSERRSSPVDFIPKRSSRPKPASHHEINQYIYELKSDLLIAIQRFGKRLPPNTLDQLIDMLEGPENVAEMTGRKGRVVHKSAEEAGEPGTYVYETRNEADVPVELMNVIQKERFMNGDKLIAIISEAASSGISLQANRYN